MVQKIVQLSWAKRSWTNRKACNGIVAVCMVASCLAVNAAEVDLEKLPRAAIKPIQFERDVKPIFENACLRCHGPEKPKSRFRLDNRESALKGGNNGVDILPGESA